MINDVKWVQAQRHASDWRHALDIAVRPLITFGAAAPCYLDGIIENTLKWGPYYLIAPGIALPHARPEQGANHNQISVTTLSTPVAFGNADAIPSGCCFAPAPRMLKHIFAPFNASASGSTRRKASRCCKMRQMIPRFSRN